MPILPSFSLTHHNWAHLDKLPSADQEFLTPRDVDFILGADAYAQLILSDVRKGDGGSPIAQNTIFGWIILGPVTNQSTHSILMHHLSIDREQSAVQDLLTKFWIQEETPTTPALQFTPDEQECESHFAATHYRDSTGRYIVRLPLKSSASQLGDSYGRAAQCLQRTLRRLSRDLSYRKLYSEFLKEYEDQSHMERASSLTCHNPSVYYLPHHGVVKESSTTIKLRVVFNGSSDTGSGISLNDILHTGAKLQRDISDILLWVRRHRVIFATDITKMFRQIRVHRDDWDLQRILWIDDHGKTVPYCLTTVTYGTRPAPFLAVRVLLQLVEDEGSKYPKAVDPLTNRRYVDDIYGGADHFSQLVEQAHHVTGICRAGGFPLAKWQSNSPELLTSIGENISTESIHLFKDCETKVLGLTWRPDSDVFKFTTVPYSSGSKITKRVILSEIAQLYDPLGFLAPVVIRAKILLQNLWLEKLSWDDEVSTHVVATWVNFRRELAGLGNIAVPRWIHLASQVSVEIHGFSDASQLAMGAVVYLRVTGPGITTRVVMVCAKTKVAPIKRLTIPRLELSAALLLVKLTRYVQDTLEISNSQVFLWTDSTVTLTWVTNHPSRWKEFVRNRVSSAQELLPHGQWRFISGRDNPADCASRGLTISQLERHSLWWDGPHWLTKSHLHWPSQRGGIDNAATLEERPGLTLTISTNSQGIWDLVHRYSSLKRLLRITSLCFRGLTILRKRNHGTAGSYISTGDLENSRLYWAKVTQACYFMAELKILTAAGTLPKSHPLTRLTAFIDAHGILRVGGRLRHSALQPESKHAIILPRDSGFTRLLIADAHQRTFHGGTQSTLAYLRTGYWIIGGRVPVRSYILRCVTCARQRGLKAQQLMGQLPLTRATPSRPFLFTGVDYAGSVFLKIGPKRGRGTRSQKGWLCIFVCFSTSALHLELVSDLTSEAFIAAFRRFTGRRGICHTLYSDNGTNFHGAAAELRRLFSSGTRESETFSQRMANDGTQWVFNPPGAPHMGGKWEAAVKSVKHHLRRTIGESVLTFEEFTTLLIQVEAVLNSRPLEPLTDDPEDLSALTPRHFLIGEALMSIPEPSLEDLNTARLSRWQLIQQRVQCFWARWSRGYLQQQQAISKWHHPSHEIRVGSLVLLTDERLPPSKWPLARVTALHPGQDGLTRVVTIRTATSTLQRPITRLAVLPISSGNHTIDSTAADGGENVQELRINS